MVRAGNNSGTATRSSKQTGVHGVHNRRRRYPSATKESAVESLNGLLAAADFVELDIYFALAVGVKGNVNDMAILLLTFCLDIILELLDPCFPCLPNSLISTNTRVQG
jgi:hypothetical protein